MRRLWLVAPAAGALLLAALLLRAAGPGPSSVPVPPGPAASAVESEVSAYSPVPPPARDVFRYADAPSVSSAAPPTPSVRPPEPPPALAPPVAEPVRLVGLVRRSGILQAALSIHGEVVVLSVGESSGGYQLLDLDEDEGATVRDSEGRPLRLPLPGS